MNKYEYTFDTTLLETGWTQQIILKTRKEKKGYYSEIVEVI